MGTEAGLDRWQPDRHACIHCTCPRTTAGSRHSLSGNQVLRCSRIERHPLGRNLRRRPRPDGPRRTGPAGASVTTTATRPRSRATTCGRLLEDRAGHLWVGTADGLDLLDRATRTDSLTIVTTKRIPHSLRDSFVLSLYQDASRPGLDRHRAGGVSRWDPRSWELGGRRPDWLGGKSSPPSPTRPTIEVWIASMGGGLVQFDADNGEATDIDAIVGGTMRSAISRVMALQQDRHGTLWIGTMTSGLQEARSATDGSNRFRSSPAIRTA